MSQTFPPYAYPTGFTQYTPFDLHRVVKIPLAPNVKSGDRVLILTDTAADPRVWQSIANAVTELGGEPTIALFSPRPADGYDPPKTVAEAMLHSNLNVLNTTTAMLHCAASARAMEHGVPSCALAYGMTAEQLVQGGSLAKWEEIQDWTARVANAYNGDVCHLTSDLGTDLTYSIKGRGRKGNVFAGREAYKYYKPTSPLSRLFGGVFPTGEANVAPVEGSANGVAYVDISMHIIKNRWLDKPIKLTIKDSKLVSIEGGNDAELLRNFLKTYGDENAYYCPAELSVGTNPTAKFIGNQKEDKNVWGSCHIGIGTNEDVGGTVRSIIHMDGVMSKPTLTVDGQTIVEKGVIKV